MCSLFSFSPNIILEHHTPQLKGSPVLNTFFNSLEVGRSKSAEMLLTVAFPSP